MPRALELLSSAARLGARDEILSALKNLTVMDGLDVLESAKSLMLAVRAPLDEMRRAHEAELVAHREFTGGTASTKPLEEKHKRELTAKEREGLLEILNVTESWLRDCRCRWDSRTGPMGRCRSPSMPSARPPTPITFSSYLSHQFSTNEPQQAPSASARHTTQRRLPHHPRPCRNHTLRQ